MQPEHDPYHGLTQVEPTLPSSAYWDLDAYQRDLDAVWCRSWLLVCREADHEAGVLMPEEYELHRFHNRVRERHTALSPKP